MIRFLMASAAPVLGLGIAASLVGPDLLAGPRGEPLLVAMANEPTIELAKFEGDACASALLLADGGAASGETPVTNVVAVRYGSDGIRVAVETFGANGATLVLVFDAAGRLVGAGDPAALDFDAAQSALEDECLDSAVSDPV